MPTKTPAAPRVAALVGPYLSGKTSLLEALLFHAGAIAKKGSVKNHDTIGDFSTEARVRGISTELSAAACTYVGEGWTLLDCPGNVEFQQDTIHALQMADIAVVVVEPDAAKAPLAGPLLKALDDQKIPHLIFVNKCNQAGVGAKLKDVVAALQVVSQRPLILREIPIRQGDTITGFVDLVSERTFGFESHADALLTKMPESVLPQEGQARREMLEHLADFDDHLMEELIEDVVPGAQEVYANLTRDLAQDLIVPVFFGSAEDDHGILRLFKALRHDAPEIAVTRARLGVPDEPTVAQVFKTVHALHIGKQSYVRVWHGNIGDGLVLGPDRVSGINRPMGGHMTKVAHAAAGEIVTFGRMDDVHTGQSLAPGRVLDLPWPQPLKPCFSFALRATKQGDDVKLGIGLARLAEEDTSLHYDQTPDTHELVLWGQGEIHLRNALDRLKNRFGVDVRSAPAQVPYKETVRKAVSGQRGRYKHQTGGHGAFGDIVINIEPLPRGQGFQFAERVVGGAVPKQYFSSVENGARETLKQGPFGFEVVDISVVLTDGSYHPVDSSDMAFKAAARIAVQEGLLAGQPVLLEPIVAVDLSIPMDFTARAQRLVTGRRGGHILGFDGRPGWSGWDIVRAHIPLACMTDLILELRGLTQGLGTFTWQFAHLAELDGRDADQVVKARKAAMAAS